MERAWLSRNGIAFEDRDIMDDRVAMDELIKLGSRSTPTTVIETEGGDRQVLIGFHEAQLRKLLGL